jgi:hypothetical protein
MSKEFIITFIFGGFLLLDYFKGLLLAPIICSPSYLLPSLCHIIPVFGGGLLAFSAYSFMSWYFFRE